MTDLQAIEWYMRRYDRDESKEFEENVQQQLEQNEREFEKKPLEKKKAEYWAMCAEFGCNEAEIQAQWDEFLRTGSTG